VFGVNSSLFLAQFLCQYHARLYGQNYPRASKVILESTYMDDSMASVLTDNEVVGLYKELIDLWGKAEIKTHNCGFLRYWKIFQSFSDEF